ncbi:uncharacterized protein LOC110686623 [Chenopodium quinoa]|uniref:uncharacterized protein LOC110686623 n=1 Tax=Chenopodium quinoa TaxID=63459 RepID=UPI000B77DB65|nr:uncharacterized protein LOC110686623 [Chenopodium quinoa]
MVQAVTLRLSLETLKTATDGDQVLQGNCLYASTLGFVDRRAPSHGDDMAYLLLYVDDIILATSSNRLRAWIISQSQIEFPMTDLGHLSYFMGIAVTRKPSYLLLFQEKYTQEILERACRPDISYALQQVCLFMHDPREPHYEALKRIMRYVQGLIDHGLHLYPTASHRLITYTDADWRGRPDTRRSTSGYCCFLGDNLVSWSSKRQHTLSKSSTEAKYRGVANFVSEACWLCNLLLELHCLLRQATIVYCDNVSAIYLSGNLVQHQRTKHVEMDIHFVREKVALGQDRVLHVPTRYQFADIFIKGLPRELFLEFRSSLSVRPPPVTPAGV